MQQKHYDIQQKKTGTFDYQPEGVVNVRLSDMVHRIFSLTEDSDNGQGQPAEVKTRYKSTSTATETEKIIMVTMQCAHLFYVLTSIRPTSIRPVRSCCTDSSKVNTAMSIFKATTHKIYL